MVAETPCGLRGDAETIFRIRGIQGTAHPGRRRVACPACGTQVSGGQQHLLCASKSSRLLRVQKASTTFVPVVCVPPRYNDSFAGVQAPRTPNYNITAVDHHWMIRTQPPLTEEQAERADELYRARLRSLLTVDDQARPPRSITRSVILSAILKSQCSLISGDVYTR